MKNHLTFALAASLAALSACGSGGGGGYNSTTGPSTGGYGGGPTTPPANTIIASASILFDPSSLTVSTGTSVTFTFESVTHNVTFTAANGVPADIPNSSNTSVTRTFATAGTYAYHCTIHPTMTGTVTVH